VVFWADKRCEQHASQANLMRYPLSSKKARRTRARIRRAKFTEDSHYHLSTLNNPGAHGIHCVFSGKISVRWRTKSFKAACSGSGIATRRANGSDAAARICGVACALGNSGRPLLNLRFTWGADATASLINSVRPPKDHYYEKSDCQGLRQERSYSESGAKEFPQPHMLQPSHAAPGTCFSACCKVRVPIIRPVACGAKCIGRERLRMLMHHRRISYFDGQLVR